jgi:hypothetical protein
MPDHEHHRGEHDRQQGAGELVDFVHSASTDLKHVVVLQNAFSANKFPASSSWLKANGTSRFILAARI